MRPDGDLDAERVFASRGGGCGVCERAGRGEARRGARGSGVPLGLQLYSVREMLPKDYEGTLKQVAAAGYRRWRRRGGSSTRLRR